MRALNIIKKQYYEQGIHPEQVIVLTYYKLATLYPYVKQNEYGEYISLTDKKTNEKIHLIEPDSISDMEEILDLDTFHGAWCTLFKTITAFKGLERDILFLVVPNLNDFKRKYPEKFKNFVMQIYVGASRAKFKLYFFEYDLR
jgi:hypothetical protein